MTYTLLQLANELSELCSLGIQELPVFAEGKIITGVVAIEEGINLLSRPKPIQPEVDPNMVLYLSKTLEIESITRYTNLGKMTKVDFILSTGEQSFVLVECKNSSYQIISQQK